MSWRDELQPASFRGVPFFVDTSDAEFGRRVQRVEYPYRDKPFTDDLGRRIREYNIDAILLGDDLFAQRSRLIDALEKAGPGSLIHPRLGALRVQLDRARWRTTAGGNVERISITFVEASEQSLPQTSVDTLDRVKIAAAKASTAQQNSFQKIFKALGQPDFVKSGAVQSLNRGFDALRAITRQGRGITESISSVIQNIDSAARDVANLILTPRDIASKVGEMVGQVLGLDDRLDSVMANYRALNVTFGNVDPIPQTTPSRRIEVANQSAVAALIGNTATIEAARLVSAQAAAIGVTSNALSPFDSADDAYAVRDELVAALEAIALTADDGVYTAVVDLQSNLVAHIEAHGQSLPRIARVSYPVVLPMLAITHRLYGATDLIVRDADLTQRNGIAAPLFVRAGTTLEALNG